ncbi:hypothetical protein [Bacillus sp. JCM 19041]|uniref:hypothetical protein n=1 Tax=Bacillus sp. JCM 19041 TaxID=1460637 RepID=UPI000B1961E1
MERNVGFFKSIRFKLIIIYMLLIFLAMQVVSVYFSRELEQNLFDNYETVLNERLNLLSLSAAQEMVSDDSTELDLDMLVRNAFPANDENVRYGKAQIIGRNASYLQVHRMPIEA